MLGGLKSKAVEVGLQWAAGPFFTALAEGKYGEKPKALYWWLKGKKTTTGFLVGVLAAAVTYFDPALAGQVGPNVALLGGVLVSAGLMDKLLHSDADLALGAEAWFTDGLHAIVGAGSAIALITAAVSHFTGGTVFGLPLDVVSGAVAAAVNFLSALLSPPPLKG